MNSGRHTLVAGLVDEGHELVNLTQRWSLHVRDRQMTIPQARLENQIIRDRSLSQRNEGPDALLAQILQVRGSRCRQHAKAS